ncbi:MAG: YeeE/YedE family protein [Desulfamplus sp.]|nr:YeeE/YedE family protein [Desulfamplus sp.]
MFHVLTLERWSPYVVGSGIGVLSWLVLLISNNVLGVSSAYVHTAGMVEKFVKGKETEKKEYYQKHPPIVDWEWMLVLGLIIGAFFSAYISGMFHFNWVPGRWESKFGHTPLLRTLTAFIGAMIMQIGARWAKGCTSGHGISGTLQLALSSWVAVLCFFIAGIATIFLIY